MKKLAYIKPTLAVTENGLDIPENYFRDECIKRPQTIDDMFVFDRCIFLDKEEGKFNDCKLMPGKSYTTWEEQYRNCPLKKK